jgi:hypothetical protein
MSCDVEISTSVCVMQCLYAIGEKRRGMDQKLYVALVTPGSSAGVKYRSLSSLRLPSWCLGTGELFYGFADDSGNI